MVIMQIIGGTMLAFVVFCVCIMLLFQRRVTVPLNQSDSRDKR